MDATSTMSNPTTGTDVCTDLDDLFALDPRTEPLAALPAAADSGDCTNDGCTGSCVSCGCK